MKRFDFFLAVTLNALMVSAYAQNAAPVVASPVAEFTEFAGAPPRSIDLLTVFSDPDTAAAARLATVFGDIDIGLYPQTPITTANFLKYVDQGRYFILDAKTNQIASSFVHRAIPGFIIQGGGFIGTVNPTPPSGAPADSALPTQVLVSDIGPIQNEFGKSNKRGTVAMAQSGTDANSATSQWFINLADNGGPPNNLDTRFNDAGPYTVFGRVLHNGMSVADTISALPRVNVGGPFTNLPLRNYTSGQTIRVPNLVSIPGVTRLAPMSFVAMSDNASVTATVSGTKLLLTGNSIGTAHISVTATDLEGATVSTMFTVNVVAAPGRLVNLSTRLQVGTGDNALIAGFIMRGGSSKRLAVRGLGPSLTAVGVDGALANPKLELHDSSTTLASNDDWGTAANKQDLTDVNLAPGSAQESAILSTVLSSSTATNYTAIMRGVNDTTGVGVVEVYDLDSGPGSTLLNISTRGPVGVDPNALIGGFILGGTESKQILVRAIGPSLTAFGVPNALIDPTLELRNAQGGLVDSNDDWMNSPQKTQIQNSGLAPTHAKESAVVQTLAAGPYTAIVRGANGGTGVGSVEVYQLP